VRVARIFNTYGPRMRADDGRVVSNMICQALAGDDITIYGEGSQTRSFCFVSDLIEGFMRLMNYEGKFPGAVNLGNPVELTVGDLATRVLSLTGSKSRIVTRPLPVDDPRRRRPDITRAEQLLNWAPSTSLDAGLRETIKWFSGELERETRPVRASISVGPPVPASPA
jgi:UDP-glucuronate decarboxylase